MLGLCRTCGGGPACLAPFRAVTDKFGETVTLVKRRDQAASRPSARVAPWPGASLCAHPR